MSAETQVAITPRSPEEVSAQKRRNVWLAIGLFAFVVLVGTTTAIRISNADLGPDDKLYFDGYLESSAPEVEAPPIPFPESDTQDTADADSLDETPK